MNSFLPFKPVLITLLLLILACNVSGQVDEICAESGNTPSLESPTAHVPYVYGRVILKGLAPNAKSPKITVILSEGQQATRLIIDKSGNYCFKRKSSGGGSIMIEIDGHEVAQRVIPSFGPPQQREDFEIFSEQSSKLAPPGVVSAKFSHPINPKTIELYKKTVEAETNIDLKKAIELLKEIVSIDKNDFIAWSKLGTLYFAQNSLEDAVSAFRKSLELKIEYLPAWINIGKMRIIQKQYEAAIEIFKHAAELEPTSAKTFRLLGETYLQAKQGSLGAKALNQAIKLDPVGMAECHLLLAHLYELAKAKNLATREYKLFLTKVPDYKDKTKLEKFIKENPE